MDNTGSNDYMEKFFCTEADLNENDEDLATAINASLLFGKSSDKTSDSYSDNDDKINDYSLYYDSNKINMTEEQQLEEAIKLSLNDEQQLDLYTEELQLETALKLSLSIKQPAYMKPLGPIYKINDIIIDVLIEPLISLGCMKVLTSFMITNCEYYDYFIRNYRKIYERMISFKHISSYHMKDLYTIKKHEKETYIRFDTPDKIVYTKKFNIVADSDKCGCVYKDGCIYMKICNGQNFYDHGNEGKSLNHIEYNSYYHIKHYKFVLGLNNNQHIRNILDANIDLKNKCHTILNSFNKQPIKYKSQKVSQAKIDKL